MNILKTYLFLLSMFSCCLISVHGNAQNGASTADLSQLIQMAEAGDADVQVDLALKNEKGQGVLQDHKEAANPHFSWTLCRISESVFILTACHPFDLTWNFTQCSPKANRYDHIRSLTAFAYLQRRYPNKHRLLYSTGVLLEYVIIFAGEKSGLNGTGKLLNREVLMLKNNGFHIYSLENAKRPNCYPQEIPE